MERASKDEGAGEEGGVLKIKRTFIFIHIAVIKTKSLFIRYSPIPSH